MNETRIAKIRATHLGEEDHGIMTAYVHLDYGNGSGMSQSFGGYALDNPLRDAQGKFIRRVGTAEGMELVFAIIRACGVDCWEQVKGRTVMAVIEDGMVRGLQPLPTEPGTAFHVDEIFAARRERRK